MRTLTRMKDWIDEHLPLFLLLCMGALLLGAVAFEWLFPCVESRASTCVYYCTIRSGEQTITYPCGTYECETCEERRYRFAAEPDPSKVEKEED